MPEFSNFVRVPYSARENESKLVQNGIFYRFVVFSQKLIIFMILGNKWIKKLPLCLISRSLGLFDIVAGETFQVRARASNIARPTWKTRTIPHCNQSEPTTRGNQQLQVYCETPAECSNQHDARFSDTRAGHTG